MVNSSCKMHLVLESPKFNSFSPVTRFKSKIVWTLVPFLAVNWSYNSNSKLHSSDMQWHRTNILIPKRKKWCHRGKIQDQERLIDSRANMKSYSSMLLFDTWWYGVIPQNFGHPYFYSPVGGSLCDLLLSLHLLFVVSVSVLSKFLPSPISSGLHWSLAYIFLLTGMVQGHQLSYTLLGLCLHNPVTIFHMFACPALCR